MAIDSPPLPRRHNRSLAQVFYLIAFIPRLRGELIKDAVCCLSREGCLLYFHLTMAEARTDLVVSFFSGGK